MLLNTRIPYYTEPSLSYSASRVVVCLAASRNRYAECVAPQALRANIFSVLWSDLHKMW